MEKKILLNSIKTPDGTVLVSKHRHDFVTHEDANGKTYGVDGGNEYLRRIGDVDDCEDLSLYVEDCDHETIRTYLSRGGRGKNGDQPLKWVPLKEMSNAWIQAVVDYEEEKRPNNPWLPYYKDEVKYREDNEIFIEDED